MASSEGEKSEPDDKTRPQVTAYLTPELRNLCHLEAAKEGVSVSAWLTEVIQKHLLESVPPPPKKTVKARIEVFFQQLGLLGHRYRAAELAGLDMELVRQMDEDENYRARLAFHYQIFLERIERRMTEIGEGLRRGQWQALVAVLNAHHPAYGIKAEVLNRILQDMIERFKKTVRKQLNAKQADAVEKLLKEEAERKVRQFK